MTPGCYLDATKEKEPEVNKPFRNVVGALMYLVTNTRPDLSYAVNSVARFMHKPGKSHWKAVTKILRYLSTTINVGIALGGDLSLKGWADASFATANEDSHSIFGSIILLGNAPVHWQSQKSKSVHLSSSEAEQYALGNVTREILWFRQLLGEIGISLNSTPIFEDNENVINWIKDRAIRARTRHIGAQLNFVREADQDGTITLTWIPGNQQIADTFTKPLAQQLFRKLFTAMGCMEIE